MIAILIIVGLIGGCAADLNQDFEDIINVIPLKEIAKIADEHNQNDPEYQEVIAYMKGTEWQAMIQEVNKQVTFKNLVKYLLQIGLDIIKIFKFIEALIESLKHYGIDNRNTILLVEQESLRSFLDEVEAIIPKQKILAVILDKLRTSEDFQKFYEQMSSEESRRLVTQTIKLSGVQKLFDILEHMGARVRDTFAVIYALLGWQIPDKY